MDKTERGDRGRERLLSHAFVDSFVRVGLHRQFRQQPGSGVSVQRDEAAHSMWRPVDWAFIDDMFNSLLIPAFTEICGRHSDPV